MPTSTTRRAFLGALAGTTAAAALPERVAAAEDLSGWFSDTGNADEVVDRRGQSSVEIAVGASGNSGNLAFAPAAVRVDPGTEVVWTWTGKGGSHNVVAQGGAFESEYYTEAGNTFSHAPSEAGVYRYFCAPHKAMGMKGALVVGDAEVTLSGGSGGSGSGGGSGGSGDGDEQSQGGDGGEQTQEDAPDRTFDGWLSGTDNYDEVVDATDRDVVTVGVGAAGNGGRLAFDPPAIHVSKGTTVVWEWLVDGERHDVRAADGSFASEPSAQVGNRYAVRFDGDGVVKYECEGHSDDGMRGVVVVGDGKTAGLGPNGVAALLGGLAVLGASLRGGVKLHAERTTGPDEDA